MRLLALLKVRVCFHYSAMLSLTKNKVVVRTRTVYLNWCVFSATQLPHLCDGETYGYTSQSTQISNQALQTIFKVSIGS